MATLQSLTVNDTGNLTLPNGTSANRPSITTNIVQWTNTGTQAVTVLAGSATTTTTSWTCPAGVTSIEVLVIAGGGSGAGGSGGGAGGGGAGGVIYTNAYTVVPGNSYTITVGAGGASSNRANNGFSGSNSVFDTLTAIGGGGGGCNTLPGVAGGSGGGSGEYSTATNGAQSAIGFGGAGTSGQGFKGGDTLLTGAGSGGGGAGGAGVNSIAGNVGPGGPGLNFSITGTPTWYAGGGGASGNSLPGSLGGSGVGGNGGAGSGGSGTVTAGAASTGSGGGGIYVGGSGAGGSGIVVIRYSLATATTQPIGQIRYNTDVNRVEHFGSNNAWIANDNPILNLDVGNTASYSGSGASWNDLANGNTFTLTASPTYGGSGASAYLTFNGSTQYATAANFIDFSSSTFDQGFTMESWCYPTGVTTGNSPLFNSAGGTSGYQWQNYLWYNPSNYFGTTQRSLNYERTQVQNDFYSTITSPVNNWYHVVASCNNQHTTLYINGVQVASNFAGQPSNTPYIMVTNSGTPYTRVGYFQNYTSNYYTGRIAVVKIYSRPLAPDQVVQNFNALRGRYGV